MAHCELFFPCAENPRTGKHSVKLTNKPMSYKDALDYVERHHAHGWKSLRIGIQPVGHPYFTTRG